MASLCCARWDAERPSRPKKLESGLILGGSATGFAAVFDAPLDGLVCAVAALSKPLGKRTSGIILTAAVLAGAAAIGVLSNYSYFGPSHARPDFWGAIAGTLI